MTIGSPDLAADLRGASLQGLRLNHVSLRGACLDEADLTGARFDHVDLAGASLRNAVLNRAWMHFVDARCATLTGARCEKSHWEQADLSGADLCGVSLHEAMVRCCVLERARVEGADLRLARLVYSHCGDASFAGASLHDANTVGTNFRGCDFTGARDFLRCREVLVEILQRDIGHDFERAQLVGAVAVGGAWCYDEWRKILDLRPHYRHLAIEILRRYPASGVLAALRGTVGDALSDGDKLSTFSLPDR